MARYRRISFYRINLAFAEWDDTLLDQLVDVARLPTLAAGVFPLADEFGRGSLLLLPTSSDGFLPRYRSAGPA